ncbi:class I SAM-dependent DNA methyltransferase [Salinactinospora qingdaonensis]|uniref:class I SAM-dependent DNA methyltransferase n=1 Tax=Salinactinospora qingdaonensis TaxID=702744 RepID=UPI0031EE615E
MTPPSTARAGGADTANLLTDNPELYERQFPDPEHRAARFVADLVERFGDGPRVYDILDVGCGTGRDLGRLVALGHRGTGVDISAAMVDHARRHWPAARFHQSDMRSFALDHTFDVLICLDSALLYCHDNADLLAFLARCRRHLVPGGLLIAEMRNGAFFLGNTELLDATTTRDITWRGVRYTSHTRLWIDHAAQLLRRRRSWQWEGGAAPLEQHSAWRLLFPQELRHYLSSSGFEVLALFDEPGPRTDTPWCFEAELSSRLSGDRLHVVARRLG